ncbi:TorF family putative porin [Motiliproteus sp.]|uniref:TorF family putative porin n=1 Tax=Motiliproteus sp. TaxID=1898955 RepID=UPI003BABB062
MMKKTVAKSALVSALLLASSASMAEISANISLTNDYRYRGISQSAENTAVQGGFDYAHDSGLFVGTWASNVDFGSGDNTNIEHDIYVGYWGEINEDLSYDVTFYRYIYSGSSGQNYNEISVGVDYMGARLAYWNAWDYFGGDNTLEYLEANYSLDLPEEISLTLHAGYNFGDELKADNSEYIDYSVSLSKTVAEVDLSLTYMDTDIDDDDAYFGKVKSGANANQSALVFSISKSF